MRLRAIAFAFWYGLLPWPLYERECHYAGMTYGAHLWLNLTYAWRWATFREDEEDQAFERSTNHGGKTWR